MELISSAQGATLTLSEVPILETKGRHFNTTLNNVIADRGWVLPSTQHLWPHIT